VSGAERAPITSHWLQEILMPLNCEVTNPSSDTALVLNDDLFEESVLRKHRLEAFVKNTPDVADAAIAASLSLQDNFSDCFCV
jgi:hypothetical protein